jgi:hypothetical protein
MLTAFNTFLWKWLLSYDKYYMATVLELLSVAVLILIAVRLHFHLCWQHAYLCRSLLPITEGLIDLTKCFILDLTVSTWNSNVVVRGVLWRHARMHSRRCGHWQDWPYIDVKIVVIKYKFVSQENTHGVYESDLRTLRWIVLKVRYMYFMN